MFYLFRGLLWGVGVLVFALARQGFAEGITEMRQTRPLFEAIGQAAILDDFLSSVAVLSIPQFIEQFEDSPHQKRLGSGVEGTVVKDRGPREASHIWKISHGVLEAIGRLQVKPTDSRISEDERARLARDWQPLTHSERLPPRDYYAWRERRRWPFKNASLIREVVGTLLWSHYSPIPVDFPTVLCEDLYGYRGKFIEGPTLDAILRDAEGKHRFHYDLRIIWKQLVTFQRQNERMLLETGFAVDLFSPSNLLVEGPESAPRLIPIDHSISRPDKEAHRWFKENGVAIPDPVVPVFPFWKKIWVVTPFLVANRLWHINYDMALDYISGYFKTRTRARAEQRLANLHIWQTESQKNIIDPRHILRARAETGMQPRGLKLQDNFSFSCPTALRRKKPDH